MATYQELADLRGLAGYPALHDRVQVAVLIAAANVYAEDPGTTNHANRLIWAANAFSSPGAETDRMLFAAIAANSTASQAQILNVADATLLTNVEDNIDLFATG